jgi:hypothetical protein
LPDQNSGITNNRALFDDPEGLQSPLSNPTLSLVLKSDHPAGEGTWKKGEGLGYGLRE